MKICISGLSGSGKNSIGLLVAKKLGMKLINPTFKTLAKKSKISLMEFHKKAEQNSSIDKNFDKALIKQAKGNCVVTTWLGPWMIKDADLKIWLNASAAARAQRIAQRDGMTSEEAQQHISQRDESNRQRYLRIYGIDIYDHSGFDLVINTEKFHPKQSAEIICCAAKAKGFKKGASKQKKR
ncbi:MAG: cytidylate kinase family protein [Candidatus Anstonellaceae archaeon]